MKICSGCHQPKLTASDGLCADCVNFPNEAKENNARNWIEDFSLENGNYNNRCIICEKIFIGHKYRRTCKKCYNAKTSI